MQEDRPDPRHGDMQEDRRDPRHDDIAPPPPIAANPITAAPADPEMMERLMQAQKMESVGQLAAGVAHDFNNLLSIILNHADFVLQDDPDRTHQMDIEQIRGAAELGRSLVRQLLMFAQGHTSRSRQEVSLGSLVENVLAMVRGSLGARIGVSMRLDPDAAPVLCDPPRLEQALVNLVLNGRDAIKDTGELVVSVTNVASSPSSQEVLLSIRDNGSGMRAEVKSRAFEPFFTTKAPDEGTGLGLSIVKAIVDDAGGRMEISSEPGEGTEVRVYLPAATES